MGIPGGAAVKNLPVSAGDTQDAGSFPEFGRSPGVGNGNPFQYSGLVNSMHRVAWQARVHGGQKKNKTQLSVGDTLVMVAAISIILANITFNQLNPVKPKL